MLSSVKSTILSLVLFLALLMSACTDSVQVGAEEDEPAFRRAQSFLKENRRAEALEAFNLVIDKRDDAPESHLEAGRLYLDYFEDPIEAIHHFRRYLDIVPEGEKSDIVRQLIETAEKQFVSTLAGKPFGENGERLGGFRRLERERQANLALKRELAALKLELEKATAENERLRRMLAQADAVVVTSPPPEPVRAPEPVAAVPETPRNVPNSYKVQAGDTLSNISRKVYGTPGRWRDIFEANRDQLPNPNALKVGQTLKIPQ